MGNDGEEDERPVHIISSSQSVENEKNALDLGAVDFIDKDVFHKNPEELRERVRMKVVTGIQEPDLKGKLKVDKKKISKLLMSEAISGDFFTASRKFFMEITTSFDLDYLSFWTISNGEPNLILCIGDLQPDNYGSDELKAEDTFQMVLEERKAYLSNHTFKGDPGILGEQSREAGLPAEIGIPLFSIDEKTLLKHKFNVPSDTPFFAYIVLKRRTLFAEKEFKLLRNLLMQAGTILWRLYSRM